MARTKHTLKRAKEAARASDPSKPVKPRKKRRFHPGTRALMEIRKQQQETKPAIPRAAMWRLIRELALQYKTDIQLNKPAVEALRQSGESFGTDLMSVGMELVVARRGLTLEAKDIRLSNDILTDPRLIQRRSRAFNKVCSKLARKPKEAITLGKKTKKKPAKTPKKAPKKVPVEEPGPPEAEPVESVDDDDEEISSPTGDDAEEDSSN